MAGITANSATTTMLAAATAADKSVSGYVTNEAITLATSPTGTTYSWGISKPSGATSRSDISDDTIAAPTFTPDVAGYWVITCTVDSTTTYVIRIAVAQVAATTPYEAIRFTPLTDSQVATPTLGGALYWSDTQSKLSIKTSTGTVSSYATFGVQLSGNFTSTYAAGASGTKSMFAPSQNLDHMMVGANGGSLVGIQAAALPNTTWTDGDVTLNVETATDAAFTSPTVVDTVSLTHNNTVTGTIGQSLHSTAAIALAANSFVRVRSVVSPAIAGSTVIVSAILSIHQAP